MEQISWPFLLGGFAFVVIVFCIIKYATHTRYPYIHRHILTQAELRFFKTLRWLIPKDAHLSVKPRLGDIVDVDKVTKNRDPNWIGNYGAAVWSKHIDFVIFDIETAEVLLCIELDDSSHDTKDARKRDAFKDKTLDAADIPLVRFRVKGRYTKAEIQNKIMEYL